jgi:hypothetical protein
MRAVSSRFWHIPFLGHLSRRRMATPKVLRKDDAIEGYNPAPILISLIRCFVMRQETSPADVIFDISSWWPGVWATASPCGSRHDCHF